MKIFRVVDIPLNNNTEKLDKNSFVTTSFMKIMFGRKYNFFVTTRIMSIKRKEKKEIFSKR